ncbi:hypothetical protein [Ottowia sp.]|uniref:hypothetical protein n=1 Tax=Ottowia sp. TaxID=1898956 RepID=UPI00345E49DD
MSDAVQGLLYLVAIVVVLGVLVLMGAGYLLDQWEGVQRAEAAVQEQQTIQQRDYLAFLAAMTAMGRQVGSPPTWLLILFGALGWGVAGYGIVVNRRRG